MNEQPPQRRVASPNRGGAQQLAPPLVHLSTQHQQKQKRQSRKVPMADRKFQMSEDEFYRTIRDDGFMGHLLLNLGFNIAKVNFDVCPRDMSLNQVADKIGMRFNVKVASSQQGQRSGRYPRINVFVTYRKLYEWLISIPRSYHETVNVVDIPPIYWDDITPLEHNPLHGPQIRSTGA